MNKTEALKEIMDIIEKASKKIEKWKVANYHKTVEFCEI